MSFNHQWHKYEVAKLWPSGSVVLLRIKVGHRPFHNHSYILINNWRPESEVWDRPSNEYQLIEEPLKK